MRVIGDGGGSPIRDRGTLALMLLVGVVGAGCGGPNADESLTEVRSAISSPGPLFTVVGETQLVANSLPPDTDGAVSASFILTTVNGFMNVKSRSGALLRSQELTGFFAPTGATGFVFDPHSRFDPFAQRFIITATNNAFDGVNAKLLIAVTQTADPTGAWHLFALPADPALQHWLDFPFPGFNKKWLLVTGTVIGVNGADSFLGMWVFNKAALYAGTSEFTFFNNGLGAVITPVETIDAAAEDQFLLRQQAGPAFDGTELFRLSGAVGAETITSVAVIPSPLPFSSTTAVTLQQIGGPTQFANGPFALTFPGVFRNGSIWATQVGAAVDEPARGVIQWLQISPTGIVQSFGRVDEHTSQVGYQFPWIAVNRNNDFLIGYSRFAPNTFPDAAYSLHASGDAPGTIRDPFVYRAGLTPVLVNRWGDFSHTQVDPVNDTDFWTVQEAMGEQNTWVTWWAQVPAGAPPACPTTPTSPRLNLRTRCTSQGTQSQDFSVRVFNWDTVPVSLGSLCVKAWAFEPVPLNLVGWNTTSGRICPPGGGPCTNINVTGQTATLSSWPACTTDPARRANQVVAYCNSSAITIPPNGGFWEPQADAFRIGRNNPQMTNNNFSDDYSHFGTGAGGCGSFTTPADTPFFDLYVNGSLVRESLGPSTADPDTGREPCSCP
jgi:hypothetical protein